MTQSEEQQEKIRSKVSKSPLPKILPLTKASTEQLNTLRLMPKVSIKGD